MMMEPTPTTHQTGPYSENENPTLDWTIEQILQWEHCRCQQENKQKADELEAKLQEEFEAGKRELQTFFKLAVTESNKRQRRDEESKEEIESSSPSENSNAVDDGTNKNSTRNSQMTEEVETEESSSADHPAASNNNPPSSLHIEVCTGPHAGSTFLLEPRVRKPCFIGRSKGKKFKDRGISLYKDTETSTTHGKFHTTKLDGKFFYTDTDSTNGTLYQKKELEGHVPILLDDGMELTVGTSLLRVSLVR